MKKLRLRLFLQDRNRIRQLVGLCLVMLASPAFSQTVKIVLFETNAREVRILGSFDRWTEGRAMTNSGNGNWSIELTVDRGRYEYKFLVDGKWRINGSSPVIEDGFGSRNNIIVVR